MLRRHRPLEYQSLTLRKLEVLLFLVAGHSPKQIAVVLDISVSRVYQHINEIARELRRQLPANGNSPKELVLLHADRLLAAQRPDVVDQVIASFHRSAPHSSEARPSDL